MKHLRAKLLKTFAAGLAAAALTISPVQGQAPVAHWGLLANPGFDRQGMKSVYFFAGQWRGPATPQSWPYTGYALNGRPFYGVPVGPNDWGYSFHPADARHLGWSESRANQDFAINAMLGAGVNVVTMSYWGPPTWDLWAFSAPMQTSTGANDELFTAAIGKNVLILPAIEGGDPTRGQPMFKDRFDLYVGHSDGFNFPDEFPNVLRFLALAFLDVGDPAPKLTLWIEDLVRRYVTHPANPEWPRKWARLYDRNGVPRYAININHVASNRLRSDEHRLFAAAFEAVAAKVYADTGVRVGFMLDLEPERVAGTGGLNYIATAREAGPLLAQQPSILGIQAFRPEGTRGFLFEQGRMDERGLIDFKRQYLQGWINAGLPVILDATSGYNGFFIFKPKPGEKSAIWGNHDGWRNEVSQLRALRIKGITFNSWNGYTEGMVAVPTLEKGSVPQPFGSWSYMGVQGDANYLWLRELFRWDPWAPYYAHFSGGQPRFLVYGAIGEKWFALGAGRGFLGAPLTSETPTPNGDGRYNEFEGGDIYWHPRLGAFEVHGAIREKWASHGRERSYLGYPISDEEPWTRGGRISRFEHGFITWTPQAGARDQRY